MANKGRPTKYKKIYIQKADEYLKQCEDEYKTIDDYKEDQGLITAGGKAVAIKKIKNRKHSIIKVKLPTIEGFASFIGVNKTSLYEWEKENEDFSNALDKIRTEQKERLLNMGLSGEYNPTIAKLILSANHGMSDKTQIEGGDEPIKHVFEWMK